MIPIAGDNTVVKNEVGILLYWSVAVLKSFFAQDNGAERLTDSGCQSDKVADGLRKESGQLPRFIGGCHGHSHWESVYALGCRASCSTRKAWRFLF